MERVYIFCSSTSSSSYVAFLHRGMHHAWEEGWVVVVVGFSASLCLGSFSFFRSLVSFSILYIRLLCIYTLRVYNTRLHSLLRCVGACVCPSPPEKRRGSLS